MSPKEHHRSEHELDAEEWIFPFEAELHAVSAQLHDAQSAWMSQIDSLRAPDRKTHELIRMVCTVIRRNPPGVARHAMLAAEVGATWEEVAGSIVLTQPAFGLLNVVEALPWARRGWEQGRRMAPHSPDGRDSRPALSVKEAKKAKKAKKAAKAHKATKTGRAHGVDQAPGAHKADHVKKAAKAKKADLAAKAKKAGPGETAAT